MIGLASNPIVRLEFMRRFRGPAAAWGIPLLALLPGVAVSVAYASGTSGIGNSVNDQMAMAQGGPVVMGPGAPGVVAGGSTGAVSVDQISSFGVPMYVAVFATALLVLIVLVPAVVGGSISSERNNNTLQPLQLTALGPTDIVVGKLVASVAYLLLLLVCLTPAMAAPFLVGGVPVSHVATAFGLLLMVCIELAAVAIAVSAVMKRAVTSIVASLLVTGALVLAPMIAMVLAFWARGHGGHFVAKTSSLRLLGSASPVSLFSWTGQLGRFKPLDFAGTSGRVASLVAWFVVTVGALLIARRAVTAPAEKDR